MIDWNHPLVKLAADNIIHWGTDKVTGVPEAYRHGGPNPIALQQKILMDQIDMLQQMRDEISASSAPVHRPSRPKSKVKTESNLKPYKPYKPYSQYAPELNGVATSCVSCAKAHLATVEAMLEESGGETVEAEPESPYAYIRAGIVQLSASLKEAGRFAYADGIDHPEVRKRLDRALKPFLSLERHAMSEERLKALDGKQRQRIEEIRQPTRELRQLLIGGIQSPPDLGRAAGYAGSLGAHLWGDARMATADEELTALLDYDWEPGNLSRSPELERRRVEPYVQRVRQAQKTLRSNPSKSQRIGLAKSLHRVREMIQSKKK